MTRYTITKTCEASDGCPFSSRVIRLIGRGADPKLPPVPYLGKVRHAVNAGDMPIL